MLQTGGGQKKQVTVKKEEQMEVGIGLYSP